jgi:hypothetical protein
MQTFCSGSMLPLRDLDLTQEQLDLVITGPGGEPLRGNSMGEIVTTSRS